MGDSARTASEADSAGNAGLTIFDFDGTEPGWFTVNDDVMGGVSTSLVIIDTGQQQLTFSGNLSLENNGGFASVRSQWRDYDLAAYQGIRLRVQGDGKTYQLRMQTEATGRDISYVANFDTTAGSWQEVFIPFAEMVPQFRGFVVEQAGPLDPAAIRSFGLMLTDKQQGAFELEVDWIRAVAGS